MIDLVTIARTWLGTPWAHNQNVKGIGVDCVNFLSEVAKESGITIEDIPKSYGKISVDNQIKLYLDRNFQYKNNLEIKANNIILYAFSGYNNHVAVATSGTTIIHENSKVGKVVEHQIDGIWLKFIKGVWELK